MTGVFDKMITNLKKPEFVNKVIGTVEPPREFTQEFNVAYDKYQKRASERLKKNVKQNEYVSSSL